MHFDLHKWNSCTYDDEKERFILLRSQSIALATISSKPHKIYEVFKEYLLNADEKIQQATKDPEVIDIFIISPGRKRNKLECGICNGSHDTGQCPFKKEMKIIFILFCFYCFNKYFKFL